MRLLSPVRLTRTIRLRLSPAFTHAALSVASGRAPWTCTRHAPMSLPFSRRPSRIRRPGVVLLARLWRVAHSIAQKGLTRKHQTCILIGNRPGRAPQRWHFTAPAWSVGMRAMAALFFVSAARTSPPYTPAPPGLPLLRSQGRMHSHVLPDSVDILRKEVRPVNFLDRRTRVARMDDDSGVVDVAEFIYQREYPLD